MAANPEIKPLQIVPTSAKHGICLSCETKNEKIFRIP